MFMYADPTTKAVDLENLMISGKLAHKLDKSELCRELQKRGIKIDGSMGQQSLLVMYAKHLQQQLDKS
jgi:hypothetical protein